jgi:membrane protein DedA with SNARE-associated domain
LPIYAIVFLATLSTTVLPIPEEATLLAAGFAAREHSAALFPCVLAGIFAVLAGDSIGYFAGRFLLARLLRTRLGTMLLPEPRRVWAERLVSTHGARAVAVARFTVGLRGFVYFAIGASGYPFARFLVIDAAAGFVEVFALVGLGFTFGELRGHAGAWVDLLAAGILAAALFGPAVARAVTNVERGS